MTKKLCPEWIGLVLTWIGGGKKKKKTLYLSFWQEKWKTQYYSIFPTLLSNKCHIVPEISRKALSVHRSVFPFVAAIISSIRFSSLPPSPFLSLTRPSRSLVVQVHEFRFVEFAPTIYPVVEILRYIQLKRKLGRIPNRFWSAFVQKIRLVLSIKFCNPRFS